jgi:hypothetical protein
MSRIQRLVEGYSGRYASLNAIEQPHACKRIDLIRCAITVGSPWGLSWDLIGQVGLTRAIYGSIVDKAFLVWENVDSTATGLHRSKAFERHTKDKKRDVSYNIGMAVAKLNSERILGIRNLIHVEFLKKKGVIAFVAGATREPDLVGEDAKGQWHIFEAKCRSTSRSSLTDALINGKTQAQQVATIHGIPPVTRSVSATYFGASEIYTCVKDPRGEGVRSLDINSNDEFARAYYAPFLISRDERIPTTEVMVDGISMDQFAITVDGRTLKIGLYKEVIEAVDSGRSDAIPSILDRFSAVSERESDDYSVGPDGFVIGTAP